MTGHLVWDDFLGLYTLLDMFDQSDEDLMLAHMIHKAHKDFEVMNCCFETLI
jgi:hypothetical protein